ncbi:MAG: hypothetical protein JXA11_05150 [Phycisphaerae bacterium]|nr:hypothetical protein [Phycisphaerae bacterium]
MKSDRFHFVLLLVPVVSCISVAAEPVKLQDDPPLPAPKSGALRGCITPPGKIRSLHAVCRATGKRHEPSSFDAKTGQFTFADLPGGAVYDVCITAADGREIEGIDLSFVDERLERLADARRKQLELPARQPGRFTNTDVQAILKFIADWRDFMDARRVLYVQGRGDRATVLVELMRLREFHDSKRSQETKPDILWRMELWYFARRGGGWERLPNVERVLRRARTSPDEWKKISVEYTPRLSMAIDDDGRSDPLTYAISDKPDPTKGRPAETSPKLQTQPHVSGIDKTATAK